MEKILATVRDVPLDSTKKTREHFDTFIMPTPAQLAGMDTTQIDLLRIEAEKAANEVSQTMTDIHVARNELKRQDIILADNWAKARQLLREYRLAAETLKSIYWQKRG